MGGHPDVRALRDISLEEFHSWWLVHAQRVDATSSAAKSRWKKAGTSILGGMKLLRAPTGEGSDDTKGAAQSDGGGDDEGDLAGDGAGGSAAVIKVRALLLLGRCFARSTCPFPFRLPRCYHHHHCTAYVDVVLRNVQNCSSSYTYSCSQCLDWVCAVLCVCRGCARWRSKWRPCSRQWRALSGDRSR